MSGHCWPWPTRVPAVVASKAEPVVEHAAWAEAVAARWRPCPSTFDPLHSGGLEGERTAAGLRFRQEWWLD
eukprot:1037822-Alexandrium_andersonii.AAC.1